MSNPSATPRCRDAARHPLVLALLVTWALLVPVVARAHVTVWPKSAANGAYERYVVRVPNEKNVPTTRVEIHFPGEVRISSFLEVAGWQLQVLTDSAGKITGAVWTGTLSPKRFVEFPFVAVNPKEGERVVWPATQTYADGQVVQWTGPDGSKAPASVTTLTTGAESGASERMPLYLSIAALLLALVSLGLSLRHPPSSRA